MNVVQEMAIAANIPMPKVYIIDDTAPNAFATGRDPKHASVAITTGLLEKLDREELQGVIGHELSHVRNFDIRFAMIVGVLVGSIALLADFFLRFTFWGGGRRSSNDRGGGGGLQVIFFVVAIVLSILAPIAARLVQLAVNRQREYLADASSVQLTRNPYGIERALAKISTDQEVLEVANRATQHLYFTNPIKKFEERSQRAVLDPPGDARPDQPSARADRRAAARGRRRRPSWPASTERRWPNRARNPLTRGSSRPRRSCAIGSRRTTTTAPELFVGGWKKSVGRPSVTWAEIVDEALCFGWIDSIRRSLPNGAWSQRLTPRRKGSNWSRVNIDNVARLEAEGRMRPAGRAAFERRTEARSGVYSYEQRHQATLDRRGGAAFRANEARWAWFSGAAALRTGPVRSGGSPAPSAPRRGSGGSRPSSRSRRGGRMPKALTPPGRNPDGSAISQPRPTAQLPVALRSRGGALPTGSGRNARQIRHSARFAWPDRRQRFVVTTAFAYRIRGDAQGWVRGLPRFEGRSNVRGILGPADGRPSLVGHRAEIAQLVEHATENRGVASSILALGTIVTTMVASSSGSGSVGRASPCQGEGRGFESRLPLHFLARGAAGRPSTNAARCPFV